MEALRTRFERKVDRSGDHHLWTGARDPNRGTGRIKVDGRSTAAHRVAWELAHGPLAPGARVLPCAAEPACVRVDHLEFEPALRSRRRRARKGDGSVREVRRGTWQLSITAPGTSGPRRIHRTVHVANRRAALDELSAFRDEHQSGPPLPDRPLYDLTINEAVERFLVEHLLLERGREPRTIDDYRRLHLRWFSPSIGHRLVRDLDAATMDRLFGQMRAAGLSRSRMNQARSLYSPFFRWAKRRGLLRHDPMAGFELPTSTKITRERTPPEVEEVCLLLSAAAEVVPDIAPLVALGAVTGMRRSELVGLRRSRIHPARSAITVDTAVSGRRLKHTKTRQRRSLHVDDATMAMLTDHFNQQGERARACDVELDPDPFVFTLAMDASMPMPPDVLTKRMAVLKEHLGIDDKQASTIERENEALALFRSPTPPRPAGKTGPAPAGGMSYANIGAALGRSERWAAAAIASAQRREAAVADGRRLDFDDSILGLRKFTSTELLDAGFNITTIAARQGHSPQVLALHYARRRPSADRQAAAHLSRVTVRPGRSPT